MTAKRPAIWGHDYEPSGEFVSFVDGDHHVCRWCRWPHDEHPNHPSRKDNRHIVAVMLDKQRSTVWA